MAEEPFAGEWSEVFGPSYLKARDSLLTALVGEDREGLHNDRLKVLSQGYKPPYGRENIWGVGLGYKGFPPDWLLCPPMRPFLNKELIRYFRQRKCLKVFVGRKAEKDNQVAKGFFASEVLRELGYKDILTEVVEVGFFRPSSAASLNFPTSGGNINLEGGTIGGLVMDDNGEAFMLSCAHVFVDFDHPAEKRIIHPSNSFGGGTVVGHCKKFELKMRSTNEVDASIASISNVSNIKFTPFAQARDIKDAEVVKKDGAASGLTEGVPTSGLISIPAIRYRWGWADFNNVFTLTGYGSFPQPNFAEPGDSGSVVQSKQGEALGIVMADSPRYKYQTIMCRAVTIEKALGVHF